MTMSFLSSTDLAVYSLLAVAGLSSYWLPQLKGFRIPWPTVGSKPAPSEADWQTETVQSLVRLQAGLEDRKMPAAIKLCRELIWEVLGGDSK